MGAVAPVSDGGLAVSASGCVQIKCTHGKGSMQSGCNFLDNLSQGVSDFAFTSAEQQQSPNPPENWDFFANKLPSRGALSIGELSSVDTETSTALLSRRSVVDL